VLSSAILRSLTFMFHNYVEVIHKEIGAARSDQLVKSMYAALFGLSIALCCQFVFQVIVKVRDNQKQAEEDSLKGYKLANLLQRYEALRSESKAIDLLNDETKIAEALKDVKTKHAELIDERKALETDKTKQITPEEILEESGRWILRAKKFKRFGYYIASSGIVILTLIVVLVVGDVYTREASVFVERSIEILTPSIPPDKVLQLRSKYRAVDSAQKFYDLNDELLTIAKEKNVALPQFSVIRR